MNDPLLHDEVDIVSNDEPIILKGKDNSVGIAFYGDKFDGFHKVGQMTELLPAFKDYYYEQRIKNFHVNASEIIRSFNREALYPQGKALHPYLTQYKSWRKKWDKDILENKKVPNMPESDRKQILQIVNNRTDISDIVSYESLEGTMQTLGGELLNDALSILRGDEALDDMYTDEILLKRKKYVVDVFSGVTKMVQGKASLLLKTSADKRETAGFMMNLLARAQSGTLTDSELETLNANYVTVPSDVK